MYRNIILDKNGLNSFVQKLGKSQIIHKYVETYWSLADLNKRDQYVRVRNINGKFYIVDNEMLTAINGHVPSNASSGEDLISIGSVRVTDLEYRSGIRVKIIQSTDRRFMYLVESETDCHELLRGTLHMKATRSIYDFLVGR